MNLQYWIRHPAVYPEILQSVEAGHKDISLQTYIVNEVSNGVSITSSLCAKIIQSGSLIMNPLIMNICLL